jgi:hypothetical protein
MDVEKTKEVILENLAPVAVRQARFERQIHGIQTLVKIGARQLVRMGSGISGLAAEQNVPTKLSANWQPPKSKRRRQCAHSRRRRNVRMRRSTHWRQT